MKKVFLPLLCICINAFTCLAQPDTLHPVDDGYYVSYGGGQGKNSLMKFDISVIPVGEIIDSVFLKVYVWERALSWDGDVKFLNVNKQDWAESDSEIVAKNYIKSDTVTQLNGFAMVTGWAKSVDIKQILLVDYGSNQYCSVYLKDPDDPTTVPMTGPPLHNSDSLMTGNILTDHIAYYSSEYSDQSLIPQLLVYHHNIATHADALNVGNMHVFPNPSSGKFTIMTGMNSGVTNIAIYNISGQCIYQKNMMQTSICVDINNQPNGMYFIQMSSHGMVTYQKLFKE